MKRSSIVAPPTTFNAPARVLDVAVFNSATRTLMVEENHPSTVKANLLLRFATAIMTLGLCAGAMTMLTPAYAGTILTVDRVANSGGGGTVGSLRFVLDTIASNCRNGPLPRPFTINFNISDEDLLAMLSSNGNLGEVKQRGIDVSAEARFNLGFGRLRSGLEFTYMLKDEYQLERGGAFFSSLGKFGANGSVTFRNQARLSNTLDHGSFSHTLAVTHKSGYRDQSYTAGDFAVFDPITFTPFAYNGTVKNYTTVDFQTRWNFNKMMSLTLGVLNLADQDPPRSLKSAGGGQQIGYDDRYYDPRGRTWYAKGEFKF